MMSQVDFDDPFLSCSFTTVFRNMQSDHRRSGLRHRNKCTEFTDIKTSDIISIRTVCNEKTKSEINRRKQIMLSGKKRDELNTTFTMVLDKTAKMIKRGELKSVLQDVWTPPTSVQGLQHYDLTDVRMSRRKRASLKYYDRLQSLTGKYFQAPTLLDMAITTNVASVGRGGYNIVDKNHEITAAAAIWILDTLRLQKKLDGLYDLLIEFDDELSACPDFFVKPMIYPAYDPEVIESVLKLIIFRNSGLHDPNGEENTSLVDEYSITLPKALKESTPLRTAYDRMIALIDPDTVTEATARYQDRIWEVYDLTFRADAAVENKYLRISRELEELEKQDPSLQIFEKALARPVSPLMMNPLEQAKKEQAEATAEHQRKIDKIQREINRIDHLSPMNNLLLPNERERFLHENEDLISDDIRNKLTDFALDDPYTYAFALLYLLDTGSDLPWLYYGSLFIAYMIQDQLPFNIRIGLDVKDTFRPERIRELYKPQYEYMHMDVMNNKANQPVVRKKGKNLAQIIYQRTLFVPPRISFDDHRFDDEEIPTQDRELFEIFTECGLWQTFTNFENKLTQLMASGMPEESSEIPDEESDDIDGLKAEIRKLREENEKLHTYSHSAYSESRSLKKENHQYSEEVSILKRELADLREIVFRQDTVEAETNKPVNYCFPVKTHGHIISFGGHTTWLNEMKKMLPDVRFVSPGVNPNSDLLKTADIVWIQPNCLSHSAFYTIMDVIRSRQIPVRYFTYSGAEKCAVQLIESI